MCQRVQSVELDLKILHPITVDIALDEGLTSGLEGSQFACDIGKGSSTDEGER